MFLIKNRHIFLLKPLQRTFRLFKHEIASFFPFLGPILACLDPDPIRIQIRNIASYTVTLPPSIPKLQFSPADTQTAKDNDDMVFSLTISLSLGLHPLEGPGGGIFSLAVGAYI